MRMWRPLYFEYLNSSVRHMLCVRWVLSTPFYDIISNWSTITSSYLCLWPVGGCAMPQTAVSTLFLGYKDLLCVLGYWEFLPLLSSPTDQVQISCDGGWFSLRIIAQRNQMIGQKQSVLKTWLRKYLMLLENNDELRFCIFSGIWDRLKCLLWYLIK